MTDVKKGNRQMIATPAEAKKLYAPLPDHVSEKIGLEAEMALYRVKSGGVEIPVAAEMTALQKKLNNRGHDTQLEAAGVLEYASAPHPVAETTALMNDVQKGLTDFYQAVADQGLHVAPYCVLPTTTQQEAMDKKVPRERLQAALTAMSQIFDPEVLNIPLITTGVQISFSPKDSDAMFRMMRRAYALTPLLIAAMNSGTGYAENNPAREDIHLRSHYYDLYGPAGGISDSYLQSSSGAELVDHHTQAVFKAKMYFAYDLDDKIILSTKDDVLTFEKLVARGLNTQSNYELAESFLYNDIKICNLRNGAGDVLGKRLEVRAADSGPHQAASTLLLIGTLVPDGAAAAGGCKV